ncbi:rhomboid-domain-containing protein [Daldinia caldariorum]|uniref:rhomboid-domain-containing protein n=1 Tax=Daldinia caldariorum TaxID=326644 RepID=UPI0020086F9C|nr:rhomboid-domain-containing protein [Daldinia caldariorum]KAI1467494.1 rhomboid-domain-containing protein [Daldinia caldariorum]
MPILPSLSPPSSFRLGLRAITGNSGNSLISCAARSFSTKHPPIASCCRYSTQGAIRPPRMPTKCRSNDLLPRISVRMLSRFRAITHYTKLPDDYEDSQGLPFRKEDLNQREVNQIFGGAHLPAPLANKLLRILHGRRVAGTLNDPNLRVNTAQFSAMDQRKALGYLRANIPVDEVINAGLRAEDELRLLEQANENGEQQPEEISSQDLPPDTATHETPIPTGRLPKIRETNSPYGVSPLDRIRAHNIAKREAEEKRLEEERKKREEEEALSNSGTLQIEQNKPKELSPMMRKFTERATSDLKAPPEMKAWERLLPQAIMTVLIFAGCILYALVYTPPKRAERMWPDIPPAAATCLALIGINLTIWMAWKFPPAWRLLNRYFLVVPATPRPFQLIGAMFSQQNFSHVFLNMVGLWFFGTRLHDEVGRANLLAIYFFSGALGFMFSLTRLVLTNGLSYTTLGSSGSVYGIIAAFFWLHKYDEFKLFGFPPDPMSGPQGLAFIGLILGLHVLPLFSRKGHNTDIPSHLGGMVAGIAGAELIKRHMDQKARIRAERLKTMGALEGAVKVKGKESEKAPQTAAGR